MCGSGYPFTFYPKFFIQILKFEKNMILKIQLKN